MRRTSEQKSVLSESDTLPHSDFLGGRARKALTNQHHQTLTNQHHQDSQSAKYESRQPIPLAQRFDKLVEQGPSSRQFEVAARTKNTVPSAASYHHNLEFDDRCGDTRKVVNSHISPFKVKVVNDLQEENFQDEYDEEEEEEEEEEHPKTTFSARRNPTATDHSLLPRKAQGAHASGSGDSNKRPHTVVTFKGSEKGYTRTYDDDIEERAIAKPDQQRINTVRPPLQGGRGGYTESDPSGAAQGNFRDAGSRGMAAGGGRGSNNMVGASAGKGNRGRGRSNTNTVGASPEGCEGSNAVLVDAGRAASNSGGVPLNTRSNGIDLKPNQSDSRETMRNSSSTWDQPNTTSRATEGNEIWGSGRGRSSGRGFGRRGGGDWRGSGGRNTGGGRGSGGSGTGEGTGGGRGSGGSGTGEGAGGGWGSGTAAGSEVGRPLETW